MTPLNPNDPRRASRTVQAAGSGSRSSSTVRPIREDLPELEPLQDEDDDEIFDEVIGQVEEPAEAAFFFLDQICEMSGLSEDQVRTSNPRSIVTPGGLFVLTVGIDRLVKAFEAAFPVDVYDRSAFADLVGVAISKEEGAFGNSSKMTRTFLFGMIEAARTASPDVATVGPLFETKASHYLKVFGLV